MIISLMISDFLSYEFDFVHLTIHFIRPGNCNMHLYPNYEVPMLADDTPCGPRK